MINDNVSLTDEQLKQLLQLARKATPTPWYVRHLDDSDAMNLIAISTSEDSGRGERFPLSMQRNWSLRPCPGSAVCWYCRWKVGGKCCFYCRCRQRYSVSD
jgi:hypothetical protein